MGRLLGLRMHANLKYDYLYCVKAGIIITSVSNNKAHNKQTVKTTTK
jgi:hypothetical protein